MSIKNITITSILTTLIMIILLSLISYNPNDNCLIFYSTSSQQVSNYLSYFGANIAAILLYLFGSAALVIVSILVLILVKYLKDNIPTEKTIALLFTIPLLCTIFYKYKFELFKAVSPGGILGKKIYLNTVSLFGKLPTSILLFTTTWAILIIFLRSSLVKLINKLNILEIRKFKSKHTTHITPTIFEPAVSTSPSGQYKLPELNLFEENSEASNKKQLKDNDNKEIINSLENKLKHFGINGKVVEIVNGPVVKLIKYQPNIETKVSQILSLEDDLALALKALSLRIIVPIPGQSCIGFEIANTKKDIIHFSDLIHNLHKFKASLPLILGKNSSGEESIIDLAKMPHLLVAGSTGSGKSSGLNSMIMSIISTKSPEEVKLILIDPKRLEFTNYEDLPHLIFPIINSPQQAVKALKWVVADMENRYNILSKFKVKNINEYHKLDPQPEEKIPYLVVIIDELADLMITSGKEVEILIARIAQLSRAAGIHLIIATQRPSVDVITGIIKINFPSRIAFRVISKVDSRTILDTNGAEKLLGAGDMLFLDSSGNITRVHGALVSNNQIHKLTQYIKSQKTASYESLEAIKNKDLQNQDHDEILDEVLKFIKNKEEISISLIQRAFKIGFNRSASIIEQLESTGHIMPCNGKKFRKVIKLDKC